MKLIVEQKVLGPRAFFASEVGIYHVQILAGDGYAPVLPTFYPQPSRSRI